MHLKPAAKFLVCAALLFSLQVHSLPLYTAREGRQCDSCHAYPFETDKQRAWQDPPLAERKCNMSCQGCHTDPGGGGMRTAAGRYLGSSTLPIWESETRPWHDRDRNLGALIARIKKPAEPAALPPANATVPQKVEPAQATKADKYRTHGLPADYFLYDPFVYGTPYGAAPGANKYAPEYGIYGKLNARPLLQVGGDMRLAYLKTDTREAFFPMQFDLGARVQPVRNFSAAATLGLVGRTDEFTTGRPRRADEMYTIRNAYLMLHELPYQLYLRGGIFQPTFGLRQEDHTAFVRRNFEMDLSRKYSAVMGLEAGLAANYPYLNVAVFANNGGQRIGDAAQNFVINPQGFGASVAAGWRDLAYGLGASAMMKERAREYGGNLRAVSVDGYINPGRFWFRHPLTIMGELAVGEYSGAFANRQFYASFIGVDYLLFSGINLKVNHHYYVADTARRGTATGRYGFGIEFTPLSWFKLLVEYRLVWIGPAGGATDASFANPLDNLSDKQWIIISHAYF
ncbi:hypothetical protein [Turneriella parva]|uniref:Alginate export domain-containing protein n=1 Tax=Turneriella parva (strain ATCC BAA-1111 / DSM 21527 / NCTC 11395 / H) TaxID=869212 RepID=I4B7M8_TURPD|nr:hypothetical protein [Turneriella parva]AFM13285.1 hypothetical protein Turpa_2645 [Turneriella parva DSM 21527]